MVHSNSDSKYDKTTALVHEWTMDGISFCKLVKTFCMSNHTDTQKANVEPYTAPIYLAKFL